MRLRNLTRQGGCCSQRWRRQTNTQDTQNAIYSCACACANTGLPTLPPLSLQGYYWIQFGCLAVCCAMMEMQKLGTKAGVYTHPPLSST
jgi:hypothetical protein